MWNNAKWLAYSQNKQIDLDSESRASSGLVCHTSTSL